MVASNGVSDVVSYIEKLERIKILRESIKNFDREDEIRHFNKIKKEYWTWHHPSGSLMSMQIQLQELLK